MKTSSELPAATLLAKGLSELGISHSEEEIPSFLLYLEELKKWNKAHNLTSLSADRDIVIRHFLDSLLFLKVLPLAARTVADIGSGAGFPGIPLKIMRPWLRVYLIEPTQKKAVFLRHICRLLGLEDVTIIDKRLEDISGLKVDVALTRALFSIGDFVVKTRGLLKEDGVLLLSKGPRVAAELRGLDTSKVIVEDIKLPFEDAVRHLVVVRS